MDMVVNRTCIGNMSSDWISFFDRNIDLGVIGIFFTIVKMCLKICSEVEKCCWIRGVTRV